MQRKSYILKERSGFAMIMAIFFMIVIATLLSYMLSATAETGKRTINTYVNEQAQLLAKSAVEIAILSVSGKDRNSTTYPGCINQINSQYPEVNPIFDIQVSIKYIGLATTGCDSLVGAESISTAESNGTMLIDVYVQNSSDLNLSEPIRYHRRTLQKL